MSPKEHLADHVTYRDEDVHVQLTDQEKGQRGMRIADLTRQLTHLEAERKATVHDLNTKLKEKRGAIEEISREIEEGVQKKMKVRTTYKFESNEVVREVDDTGELLGKRKMNDVDRQLELSLRPKAAETPKDGTVDLEEEKKKRKKD